MTSCGTPKCDQLNFIYVFILTESEFEMPHFNNSLLLRKGVFYAQHVQQHFEHKLENTNEKVSGLLPDYNISSSQSLQSS